MSIVKNLFVYWLGILPFFVWRGYEGPKVFLFLLGGLVLVIFWLYRILKTKKTTEISGSDFCFLVWLFVLTASGVSGPDPWLSILGGSYRHQSVIFFLTLWLVKKTLEILPLSQKETLRKFFFWGVFLEAVISVARPLGTFGNSNAVAGFLVTYPLFVSPKIQKKKLFFPWLIILTAIVLTGSRVGIIAFLISSLSLTPVLYRKIGMMLLPLVAIVVFIALPRPFSIFENRTLFWRFGIEAFLEKPWLGYGAEANEKIYNRAFTKAEMPLEGMIVDRSHDLFLDVALWSGVIGLSLFIFWLVLNFKKTPYVLTGWMVFAALQPLGVVHWLMLIFITAELDRG